MRPTLFPKILLTTVLLLTALLFWLPARTSWASYSVPAASSNSSPGNRVCGRVTSYMPATASAKGSLGIDSAVLPIAMGVTLPNITVGADVCLTICLDAWNQIAGVSGFTVTTGGAPSVCGFVTMFRRATPFEQGLITIAGLTYKIRTDVQIPGSALAAEGANVCLSPVFSGGLLVAGTTISAPGTPTLQMKTPLIVNGVDTDDQFLLPEPMVFTVQPAPAGASVFTVDLSNYGFAYGIEGTRVQGLTMSTPNEAVRATTCTDSFWDGVFQIASSGNTNGDMVTFYLQNPDGSNVKTVAMLTLENGAAKVTRVHGDARLLWGGQERQEGSSIPLNLSAGSAGARTPTLTFVISQGSRTFDGCFQLAAEIKRGSGEGKTSLVILYLQVKRMETLDDPTGTGIFHGSSGRIPVGKVCKMICESCSPPPPPPPTPGTLSGTVFCDANDDGIQQSGEAGLKDVRIVLTRPDGSEVDTFTNSAGYYSFANLMPGTYKITEIQPAGVADGKDTVGSLGGNTTNDMFSQIVLPSGGSGTGYNFAELCPMMPKKCDTICWRSSQYFITFIRNLPGGAILIPGVNANNPIGIQQNLDKIKSALSGGNTPMLKLSKEYVTGQLSIAGAGGQNSPVTFNTYWSPLSCSGVSFGEITLSTGYKFTPGSLLNDLVEQTVVAVKENRSADYEKLATLWAMLNGRC
ncbi:MAG: SdrD B-like domain-containing protein [Blastocatellia bacterium]